MAQRLAKRLPRRNVWYIARNSPVVRLSAWLGPEGCDQSWPEKQQTRNRSAARSASAECCGMRPAKRERGQMRSAQAGGDCLRFGSARSVDERRLFEAELVELAQDLREANAKLEQRRMLTTCLTTNEQCPEGPND